MSLSPPTIDDLCARLTAIETQITYLQREAAAVRTCIEDRRRALYNRAADDAALAEGR